MSSFKVPKNRIFPKGLTHACGKKMYFFLELFSVKIRLEITFNNVLETKETFLGHKKFSLSKSQKSHFSDRVNPCFWSKNVFFFLYLFSVKIRLEIMFNNVIDKKETFFGNTKFNLLKSQNSHFSKAVNSCFWSKKRRFFLELFSVTIRLEIMLNNFLEKKETFFGQNKTSNNV